MANANLWVAIGNVARQPDIRTPRPDLLIATFGFAVNEKHGDKEETLFIDVTAFGKTAEIVEKYVNKGDPLFIQGKLRLESWEDKSTGEKRNKISVTLDKFQMLGARKEGGGEPRQRYDQREQRGRDERPPARHDRGQPTPRREPPPRHNEPDDDIPF